MISRVPDFADLASETPPPLAEEQFATDFSIHSISYDQIISGGPPRDGIPPIDNPVFVPAAEADAWLSPQEPVIVLALQDTVRAYPIQILIHHEIVHDEIGGTPVLITFCPLCNTAIGYERTISDRNLNFSSTGWLRYSNLIMYDRQTETWWQQATGEAIIGELTGSRLTPLPVSMVSWAEFLAAHPAGEVLSKDTGYNKRYGENPYLGYDDVDSSPALFEGKPLNGRLPPLARVITLDLGGQPAAYPYSMLSEAYVINDHVAGTPIAVFWQPGATSPLDAVQIDAGRPVGSAAAYSRLINGRMLTFVFQGDEIIDLESNSAWNIFGRAVSGELAGAALTRIPAINHFWFSWAAFKPETRIYTPDS